MQFLSLKSDIPFMRFSRTTTAISVVTFVLAVFFLATRGLHFGVEFTGGTVMEVHFQEAADVDAVRKAVEGQGFTEASVQNYGSSLDLMVRLPTKADMTTAQASDRAFTAIRGAAPGAELRRVEFIGPQVGKELVTGGLLALGAVCAGIVGYLALRFEWRFAVAAILANLHDVVIILGFFSFFQWEFSITVLAAVLSVLGYSVNESVVVFDRVRENFRKIKSKSVPEIIDNAITRTMSRTIITHLSTQMMVTSILFFGGETLHNFALALTIGILFGIYSSVLVACPIAMWLGVSPRSFQPAEGAKAAAQTP